MISVVQRVVRSSVIIEGSVYSSIEKGLVILCGFSKSDTHRDITWTVNKILNLRIFSNQNGKFDFSVKDINGELLVVSQFTLLGDVLKGRRPDFTDAMDKEKAVEFYNIFVDEFKRNYVPEKIKTGVFQADMLVEIHNDGPVTIILDSSKTRC